MTPQTLPVAASNTEVLRPYAPPALSDLGLIHEQTQTGGSDSGTLNPPPSEYCPLCC
jgi:hypothetical protein